jgi:RNA polymerase primary sigma factor
MQSFIVNNKLCNVNNNMKRMKELRIEVRNTNRSRGIERYFNDISKNDRVTADEEVELAKRIQVGDPVALERLVGANLRFVVSVAKQYAGADAELLEELIAQGNIGLIDAAKTFDYTRGFKFITYAVWHIRKEILFYFNSLNKTVYLPSHVARDLSRARRAEEALLSQHNRPVTIEEVVEEMARNGWKMSVDHLSYIQNAAHDATPLEPQNSDDDLLAPIQWLHSDLDPTLGAVSGDARKLFEILAAELKEKERTVVFLKYGISVPEPLTYYEIANQFGKTSEWARQLTKKALLKMQIRAKHLKKYKVEL